MIWLDDVKFFPRTKEAQGEKKSIATRIIEMSSESEYYQAKETYLDLMGTVYYILRWDCLLESGKNDRIYDILEINSLGGVTGLIKDNLTEEEFESWLISAQLPVL